MLHSHDLDAFLPFHPLLCTLMLKHDGKIAKKNNQYIKLVP